MVFPQTPELTSTTFPDETLTTSEPEFDQFEPQAPEGPSPMEAAGGADLSVLADWLGLGVNLGIFLTAIITACVALKTLSDNRTIQRNANRPMMVARLLKPERPKDVLKLEVANVGNSVARNVQVKFDPELPEADLDSLNKNAMDGQNFYRDPPMAVVREVFFKKVFKTWVPGQSVTVPFWARPKGGAPPGKPFPKSAEGVPPSVEVSISFEDDEGRPYTDTYEVTPQIWRGMQFTESEETKIRKGIEQINKSLGN